MPQLTTIQRNLTVNFIAQRRLNVSAVWFKKESAVPVEGPEQTITQDWLVEGEERNLGAELRDGFVELQIKAPDDVWFKLFASQVDARAAWGGHLKPVSSVLFKIADPASVDAWIDRWPRGSRDNANAWVETKLAYTPAPTKRAKPVIHYSAPLPGSRFAGTTMVWRPMGKPAADDMELGAEDLEARPVPATNMETLCRAIAFATLGYWINVYLDHGPWDESLLRTLGGWIAREAFIDGPAVNAKGKSLEGLCWAPVDGGASAAELIRFLGGLGAPKALEGFFHRAEQELERNRQAPISGWPAMERTLGVAAKIGVRRAFRAGGDVEAIEVMSERYTYDVSGDVYVDRDALVKGLPFEFTYKALFARHGKDDQIFFGQKSYNPFQIYAQSKLRTDVELHEFYPGQEPGAYLRYSRAHGLVTSDDRYADEYRILNTFPGFAVKPVGVIDPQIMVAAISMVDRMFGLLTRDNDAQMMWLKKFIAWIIQHPEIKQQVCPILVGGQGIGKSRFGISFMSALFQEMAGQAKAGSLDDDKFLVTPFRGKLITFVDEVRMESVGAINIIKNLVREDKISGQIKFGHQRDYYIPSRLILATNSPDIGLTPEDAADRAFFFIMSHTPQNMHKTDNEFLAWTGTLKPFYDTVLANLQSVPFKQHLMRYFMDIAVERAELEDLSLSSRDDENVVRATMSKSREVARAIVADARVIQGMDISAWFSPVQLRDAIKRVDGSRTKVEASAVLLEFERAGVIEMARGDLRKFKFKYGKLLQKMGEAHNLEIAPNWNFRPDDFADNDVVSPSGGEPWRGNKQGQQAHGKRYDPDDIGMSD